jgi:acetyl-CoA carboxylase biotin carboxylase subunit
MIKSLLIANRGEIALRIARTCKKMGIQPFFVYEKADQDLPHAKMKDSFSINSYMSADDMISLSKKHSIDAIHPGYGFISENPMFPRLAEENGIEFVGPSSRTMEKLGDKQTMLMNVSFANLPRIPGRFVDINNEEAILDSTEELGFPLIAKGKESGGGRQIKVSHTKEELLDSISRVKREGIDQIYISKFMTNVKHIEVQLLGDKKGKIIALSNRDCSIQRRFQKLVEEAPSSIPLALQKEIEYTAIRAAYLGDYLNAGTIEFLVDQESNYYFMEVNPRLQVEHTVTEEVFGIDLVEMQIQLANGEELGLKTAELKPKGHAIQVRINAEDPFNDFNGTAGKITKFQAPNGTNDYKTRMDTFIRSGLTIPAVYDSMVAKLIVHTKNREKSINSMLKAIKNTRIEGINTTLPFYEGILHHPIFLGAGHRTNYLNLYLDDLLQLTSLCSFTKQRNG